MAIKFETFLKWAESRFGDVVVKGDEIKVNSIFAEDYKHHMWCSPKGGKNKHSNGVYHCWKTDKSGSLVSLAMIVDKCSYEEACETLGANDYDLADCERRLEEFMNSRTPSTVAELTGEEFAGIKLPEQTFPILSLDPENLWRIEAEEYLKNRKLDPKNYFICVGGEYKNRIIIPYYDENKKLIYWNGRYLTNTDKVVKYLGPKRDDNNGIGKGDVVYISGDWPEVGEEVHFTEGEFDADSVRLANLYSGALGGKGIEDAQIAIILSRRWKIVLCFDTDLGKKVDAGGEALLKIGDTLIKEGLDVSYVRPPKQFKDWNQMYVSVGAKVMNAYMRREKKPFTSDTSLYLKIARSF